MELGIVWNQLRASRGSLIWGRAHGGPRRLLYTRGMADAPLLTVFAEVHAKPGKEQALRDALTALVPITRKEAGYVQYDLHVDNDDPGHFFFYENWVSRAHLDAHLAAPHLTDFLSRAEELLAEPARLVFATKLG